MFTDPDFINRYKNKYYGKYRASVVDINDPDELGRVKLSIPEVYGVSIDGTTAISGWAFPCGGASISGGICRTPIVNDIVWAEFEFGDPDRPLWMHGPWTRLYGNNMALHSRGRYDESDIIDRGGYDTPDTKNTTNLGSTQTWQTAVGQIEFDESEDNSRFLIHHKSGTRIEILSDGTMEINTQGNRRDINRGSYKQHVAGKRKILVDGVSIESYGSRNVNVGGTYNKTVVGDITNSAKTVTENVGQIEDTPNVFFGQKTTNTGSIIENVSSVSKEKVGDTKLITTGRAFDVTSAGMDTNSGFSAIKLQNFNNISGDINLINGPVPVTSSLHSGSLSLGLFPFLPGSINIVNSITGNLAGSSYASIGKESISIASSTVTTVTRSTPTTIPNTLVKAQFINDLSALLNILAGTLATVAQEPITGAVLSPMIVTLADSLLPLRLNPLTTTTTLLAE